MPGLARLLGRSPLVIVDDRDRHLSPSLPRDMEHIERSSSTAPSDSPSSARLMACPNPSLRCTAGTLANLALAVRSPASSRTGAAALHGQALVPIGTVIGC